MRHNPSFELRLMHSVDDGILQLKYNHAKRSSLGWNLEVPLERIARRVTSSNMGGHVTRSNHPMKVHVN